jgi:hypothetical protein
VRGRFESLTKGNVIDLSRFCHVAAKQNGPHRCEPFYIVLHIDGQGRNRTVDTWIFKAKLPLADLYKSVPCLTRNIDKKPCEVSRNRELLLEVVTFWPRRLPTMQTLASRERP